MKFSSVLYRFGSLTLSGWLVLSTAALAFKPSNVEGRPNYRRSGGTRDPVPSCLAHPETGQVLTALVPAQTSRTASAYPDMQWFMPENNASYLEFKLYQVTAEDGLAPLYQMAHALSGEGGIATLSLPPQVGLPPLAVGETYFWSIDVYCDVGSDEVDMGVSGYIERVALTAQIQADLAAAGTPLERAAIAAENGLWHDAASYLMTDRTEDPAVQQAWESLLEAVDLSELTTVPLL
ncbi:MAG: DUF928 domain-containing protein [Cyanobacteria bacterium P01_A01_bin.105]